MTKILLAYDGSDGARRALHLVTELFRGEGVVVRVVAVAEGVPLVGHASTLPSPAQDEERRQALNEAARMLADRGFAPAAALRNGDPATAILDEAEREGVDLVVLGTRGLSTMERWLVGSVSSKVLQHASCSVLVAR